MDARIRNDRRRMDPILGKNSIPINGSAMTRRGGKIELSRVRGITFVIDLTNFLFSLKRTQKLI